MVTEKNTRFLRYGAARVFRRNVCFLACAVLIYFLHDNAVSRLPTSRC